jgi:hypothetical protein
MLLLLLWLSRNLVSGDEGWGWVSERLREGVLLFVWIVCGFFFSEKLTSMVTDWIFKKLSELRKKLSGGS